jgi:hypothetical protein
MWKSLKSQGTTPPPHWCGGWCVCVWRLTSPTATGITHISTGGEGPTRRLNMELDLQSLFGLHCTPVLIGWDPSTPTPHPCSWAHIRERYCVIQDRRHLFVIPCTDPSPLQKFHTDSQRELKRSRGQIVFALLIFSFFGLKYTHIQETIFRWHTYTTLHSKTPTPTFPLISSFHQL